jgi:hypothetical protein
MANLVQQETYLHWDHFRGKEDETKPLFGKEEINCKVS